MEQQGEGKGGRGRGIYQHPVPFHSKDGHPGPQREPFNLASGPPRAPPPQPGPQPITLKHSSSEDSEPATCLANYFRLEKKPDWNIYQYRFDFTPEVQAIKLLDSIVEVGLKRDILGGFLFDGTQLSLTKPIKGSTMEYVGKGSFDEQEYTVVIKMTGLVSMNESQSLQVLNLILRHAAAISIPNLKADDFIKALQRAGAGMRFVIKDPRIGLMSVATKVGIQMNAKLDGLPRLMDVPVSGLMTVGYDVCHDPKDKSKSWGAMVATMDLKTRNNEFFSVVNRHSMGEEMSNYMGMNLAKALLKFLEINGVLPQRILVFRDGVGDGQIYQVAHLELAALTETMKEIYGKHGLKEPKFMFMVISTQMDYRERYDFYLVPQALNRRTVAPTAYTTIQNTFGIQTEQVQQLTAHLTNFDCRCKKYVPLPCFYAQMLAWRASHLASY